MKKRILIVEDNEQNLYLATFLLEQSGYEVIAAQNGLEAIDKTLSEKPDLILMDIQLPEINGYEATKRIKSMTEVRHIPIVALTSYAMPGDREKALAIGCVGYIEKPFDPKTFLSEIEKYLLYIMDIYQSLRFQEQPYHNNLIKTSKILRLFLHNCP